MDGDSGRERESWEEVSRLCVEKHSDEEAKITSQSTATKADRRRETSAIL